MPLLYLGVGSVVLSIILYEGLRNKTIGVVLLLLGALFLRIFIARMDPFLHMWDEQIHAVVAKHMMTHPFKPMLFTDTLLGYDSQNWSANHIWLHKQPLFLWQLALSMKLFGVNVFVLRLPSIVLSTAVVYLIYRMGSLVYTKAAGFYGAILMAGSTFVLQLIAGRIPTDHNDIAFLFYVTASIWAWTEYQQKNRLVWLLLIGIFSGGAVLVKWLPGLLVFSGWFLQIVFTEKNKRKAFTDFLISFSVTLIVFLPWQMYTFIVFPMESHYEMTYNSAHFFKVIEGHGGPWYFHFDQISQIYGFGWKVILPVSLAIFLLMKLKKSYKIVFITFLVVVYIFYSLAGTKMPAFTLMVVPIVYLITGVVLAWLLHVVSQFVKNRKKRVVVKGLLSAVMLIFLFLKFFDAGKLTLSKNPREKALYAWKIRQTLVLKSFPQIFRDGHYYFFNMKGHNYLKLMFYTNFEGRSRLPSADDMKQLRKKGFTPVVLDDGKLPESIVKNHAILKYRNPEWDKNCKGKPGIYQ